ncbi:hypothetical protein Patl1_33635 [Pistacia atlantica]|uniref:Uncharacterized protein n=1 Tax=Pistacia atlantica TaxID=434234 RepID=A0ACC0ZRC7_9ROSI|nr:hypothetical protein Patl1_33635 [Pistacia atlantica]
MANTRGNFSFTALQPLELPTISKFKIGLCQLSVSVDKNQNLIHAHNSIKFAAEKGARLVVLPEMWNCPYSNDYFAKYAENFEEKDASPSFSMLSEAALSLGITIVGGSMPECDSGKLFNTCCVFGADGKLKAKHRKVIWSKIIRYGFDFIDVDGKSQENYEKEDIEESDIFTAGDRPTMVDTEMGCIGVGICHDIRFPELAMLYRAKGAHLICYPGAFNISTGELLWELVQRARAADNQLFVATCSPSRESNGSYMIWGHSTLVGPVLKILALVTLTGEITATSGHEETVVVAEIDYSAIQLQREHIPVQNQRRGDVYKFIRLAVGCIGHLGSPFSSVLNACARMPAFLEGKQVQAKVVQLGYGKCGDVSQAKRVFDEILEPDASCWAAMVACYAQNGYAEEKY